MTKDATGYLARKHPDEFPGSWWVVTTSTHANAPMKGKAVRLSCPRCGRPIILAIDPGLIFHDGRVKNVVVCLARPCEWYGIVTLDRWNEG